MDQEQRDRYNDKMVEHLRDIWLDLPEEETPSMTCAWCDRPIYDDEDYYEIKGENVCADCVDDCKRYGI